MTQDRIRTHCCYCGYNPCGCAVVREPQPPTPSAGFDGSIADASKSTAFTYVNIVGKECEGWLNLFFGENCVAMIENTELADAIRSGHEEKQ